MTVTLPEIGCLHYSYIRGESGQNITFLEIGPLDNCHVPEHKESGFLSRSWK